MPTKKRIVLKKPRFEEKIFAGIMIKENQTVLFHNQEITDQFLQVAFELFSETKEVINHQTGKKYLVRITEAGEVL
jgi:hypothetical protein